MIKHMVEHTIKHMIKCVIMHTNKPKSHVPEDVERAYMQVQGAILCCREEVGIIKGGGHCCDPPSLAVMHLPLPVWGSQHVCTTAKKTEHCLPIN